MGKTHGMGAGRKVKTHRKNHSWADKAYKKSHLGNEWKKPFAGSSHAKGIVLEKIGNEAKQPDSAICKCARVQLVKDGKKIAAFARFWTNGVGAGRKLKTHRRNHSWADKAYKKSHLGNEWKKPFAGSSHAKGIVLEKIGIEAKQPDSAICKCVRVQLVKDGKKIAAFAPNDGCLNYIEENDAVLLARFGRKGHAVGDILGVQFKVIKVSGVSLLALFNEKKKPRS